MVGAKEFAIGRKVAEKDENPIVKNISMSKEKRGEGEFLSPTGTFLDRFKKPKQAAKVIKRTPREKEFNPLETIGHMPFGFMVRHCEHMENALEDDDVEENSMSDELINRITRQVFENVKSYLDNNSGRNSLGSRQIKIAIDI